MSEVEKILELKNLSDKERYNDSYKQLCNEFGITTQDILEQRVQIIALFENYKQAIQKDLSELTVQIMNLMQNFKTNATKFVSGGYASAGRSARLNLNGLNNLKTEWNKKSLLLS